MTDHLGRITGSLSQIRTHVAAAQELEVQDTLRALLDAIAREAEHIERALQHEYDHAFVATSDDEPAAGSSPDDP